MPCYVPIIKVRMECAFCVHTAVFLGEHNTGTGQVSPDVSRSLRREH